MIYKKKKKDLTLAGVVPLMVIAQRVMIRLRQEIPDQRDLSGYIADPRAVKTAKWLVGLGEWHHVIVRKLLSNP